MRKFLFLALAILLVVSQVALASFSDVSTGDDYEVAISWMSDNGVIEGYPDGTFGPEICVNRVEMLKLLFEMMEVDVSGATGALFTDTPEGQWYEQYLRAGRDRGTVEGYPDGTFKPAQCVNRVEAMKMAVLEFNDGIVPSYPELISPKMDTEPGAWYGSYLGYSEYANILGLEHIETLDQGYNFFPGDDMTRKEVAEMLYRAKAIQDNNVDVYYEGYEPDSIITNTLSVTFSDITPLDNDVVMANYKDDILDIYNVSMTYTWADIDDLFEWYEVGVINDAPYDGWKLTVLDNICEGMCMSSYVYRFAYNESTGELVMLEKHDADNYSPDYINPLLADTDSVSVIEGLDLPETIAIPGTSDVVKLVQKDSYYNKYDNLTDVAFTSPVVGDVYYSADGTFGGCVYAVSLDGAISTYEYNPGLYEDGSNVIYWEAGGSTPVMDNYVYYSTGCGIMGSCYYIKDIADDELVLAGSTSAGVELYEVVDPYEGASETNGGNGAQIDLANYYVMYTNLYQFTMEGATEVPLAFEDFLDLNPVLYWQDPFGRWSAIVSTDVHPPAECGKPVIYLYPESTIDVHVEVDIDEFTETIPDYGTDGWTVKANPDGSLYNYADGKEYPYLFWEGHKKDALGTDEGFVIARGELKEFFNGSLAEMGLNETEAADFMEFWVPRMLDNSEEYFFISFIGTHDFNKVAPLTIEPKPDTLIRVFMYYHPIDKAYEVREQKLSAIPRCGFTVIEWGGTSSSPWRK